MPAVDDRVPDPPNLQGLELRAGADLHVFAYTLDLLPFLAQEGGTCTEW